MGLDRHKLAAYTKWREGSPVNSEESPLIHTETEDQMTVNDTQIENSLLNDAVNASVSTAKLPGKKP